MYQTFDSNNKGSESASGWQQGISWMKENVLGAAPVVGSFFTKPPKQAAKTTFHHMIMHAGGYLGMFYHMYYFLDEGHAHDGHMTTQQISANDVAKDTAEMMAFMMLGEWMAATTYNAASSLVSYCWQSGSDAGDSTELTTKKEKNANTV